MSKVKSLIDALTVGASSSGRVVGATETTISVATRTGVVVVPKDSMNLYAVGDEVKVANGTVVGKVRGTDSLPVYYV